MIKSEAMVAVVIAVILIVKTVSHVHGYVPEHPEWLQPKNSNQNPALEKPIEPVPDDGIMDSVEELSDHLDYLDAKAVYNKQQLREAIASGFQPENQNFTTIEQVNTYLDAWEKNQTAEREVTNNASLNSFTLTNNKTE